MAVYPKQAGKVYEKIFFRLSQPIDSIGIRFSAGIAAAAVIKKALKALINDLKESASASAEEELNGLADQDKAIKAIEKRIKDAKAMVKKEAAELDFKLELKRIGTEDIKFETQQLIAQADARLVKLDPEKKSDKKVVAALNKDKDVLKGRLTRIDEEFEAIGGQVDETDARRLILKKIYNIAHAELDRYLNAEKRVLVRVVENLWEKYAVSADKLEGYRVTTIATMRGFLTSLGYRT